MADTHGTNDIIINSDCGNADSAYPADSGIGGTSTGSIDYQKPTTGTEAGTKKRGRPLGRTSTGTAESSGTTTGKSTKAGKALVREKIVSGILFAHSAIALMVVEKDPDFAALWAIDEKKAESLATALQDVADLYDVTPDPKTAAWMGLITTAGIMYAPQMFYLMNRK